MCVPLAYSVTDSFVGSVSSNSQNATQCNNSDDENSESQEYVGSSSPGIYILSCCSRFYHSFTDKLPFLYFKTSFQKQKERRLVIVKLCKYQDAQSKKRW